jgi:hypothetical protein
MLGAYLMLLPIHYLDVTFSFSGHCVQLPTVIDELLIYIEQYLERGQAKYLAICKFVETCQKI